MSFFTPETARVYAETLTDEAIADIESVENNERLKAFALYLCDREN
jgi:hypothetical protein